MMLELAVMKRIQVQEASHNVATLIQMFLNIYQACSAKLTHMAVYGKGEIVKKFAQVKMLHIKSRFRNEIGNKI